MERAITDAVAEALSRKIVEQVTENLAVQWATIVSELASTRKSNENLSNKIETLERQHQVETAIAIEKLQAATLELQKNRENNQKAAKILSETLKDLGIEE